MSPGQCADARRVFSSEAEKKEIGLVLRQEGLTRRAVAARTVADPHPKIADNAADDRRTSVGGSDEDDPANFRNNFVTERLTK